jgi:putative FmdB family regulatory protein
VPTYQYVCTECGGQLEAVQRFTDEPLTVHEDCGGRLRKVFSPVGIVFKGSGFYKTDSRSGPSSTAASVKDNGAKDESKAKSAGETATAPATASPASSPASPAPASSGSGGSSGEKVA